jgi:NodT family efflux transporter outer membrane factor (OMF) lipoprotein
MTPIVPRSLCLVTLLALAACTVGPDYVRPEMPTPPAYKEAKDWKPATPRDAEARGKWWEIYGDPVLDGLVAQVAISNQNVAIAEAQLRQALALVEGTRSGYFPTVGANASRTRSQSPAGSGNVVGGGGAVVVGATNTNSVSASVSWEIDLWGRVRRSVESSGAQAQASAAELAAATLSAQAQLARSYFDYRITGAQQKLFDETVEAYEKSLQLTTNRYNAGVAARAEVVQAEAQLRSAQAQQLDIAIQRAQLEHAIALLLGKAPADFAMPPGQVQPAAPAVPVGIPSELLERRPDIAAAERQVASANAKIGVAESAYYPSFSISGTGGTRAADYTDLFTSPTRFWSVGPLLALTLFDGGARRSVSDQAIANYDASVAAYRQTVLGAFVEVEDNLVALRVLEQEQVVQQQALKAARESLALTLNQYKAGTVSYLAVVIVQTQAFSEERAALNLRARELAASVNLVKAMGGGWSAAELARP